MRGWDSSHSNPSRRPTFWRVALLAPGLFPGPLLHHAGLWAAASGAPELAERLFEAAALRYRRDLRVEPLARLRVHQLMFRARRCGSESPSDVHLEVERRLFTLQVIESPRPPFGVVSARSLVGDWPMLVAGRPSVPWRAAEGTTAPRRAAA